MRYFKIVAIIAMATAIFAVPNFSSAQTVANLQAQISALLAQIQQLQAQLAQMQGGTTQWCHVFNVNLKVGDQGDEIEALHTALEKEGFNVFAAGPEVSVSEVRYFSEKTASAVSGFQQKYADEILTPLGLKYGTGFVGKATRAKLNSLYGCGIVPKPTCEVFVTCIEGTTQTYVGADEKGCPRYECRPVRVVCAELACQIGYTPYDTGQKDSNGCPIKKCIPISGNQPPVISGVSGPTTLKINETGTWTVKASDPEQGVLTYSVVWGDEIVTGGTSVGYAPTIYTQTATFTHSYSKAGIYNPTFTVTDNQGLSARTSISVNVGEVTGPFFSITVNPPVPQTTDNGIYSLTPGSVYTFTGTVKNVQAYQPGYLSLRRPDGSLKYDRYFIGQTDSTGYLSQSTTQTIIGGQTGTYIAWINVGTWTSGAVKFNIYPAPTPSITVLSPNGGETWEIGSNYNITWKIQGVSRIYVSLIRTDVGTEREILRIANGISASLGQYTWQIPSNLAIENMTGPGWKIKIGDYDATMSTGAGPDTSDAAFSIVAAGNVVYPTQTGCIKSPAYYGDQCDGYRCIKNLEASSACYSYEQCLQNQNQRDGTCVKTPTYKGDLCDGYRFMAGISRSCYNYEQCQTACASTPSITVLSPNGGESWQIGSTQTIRWSSSNASRISLDLVNSSGGLVVKNLVNMTGNPGSATWTIPTYVSPGQYWLRVGTCPDSVASCITTGSIDPVTIYDTSDAAFSIVGAGTSSITVVSPNGGEKFQQGAAYQIRWQSTGITSGNVKITTCMTVASYSAVSRSETRCSLPLTVPNSGLYQSTFGQAASIGDYTVRVEDATNLAVFDESDAAFSIVAAGTSSIAVLSPNGGEVWPFGSNQTIRWSSNNIPASNLVRITLRHYQSSALTYSEYLLKDNISNDGVEEINYNNWPDVGLDTSFKIYIKTAVGDLIVGDDSNSTFSIVSSSYNCHRCSTYYKYAWADFTAASDADCAAGAGAAPGTVVAYSKNCSCTAGANTYNAAWNSECTGTVPLSCSPGQLIGDIDNDGKVTKNDADLVGKMGVGTISKPSNTCCVDLNQDGKIDIVDALKIARIAEGLDSSPGSCAVSSGVGQSSQLNQMASVLESMKNLLYLLLQAIGH